jgi:FkbM family methyltransferase
MNIIRFLAFRLKSLRGMTIVHVGAHFGEEAARYQNWGAKRVVWVEAEPAVFEELNRRIAALQKEPQRLLQRLLGFPKTDHVLINALAGETDGGTAAFHLFDNAGASNSMFRLHRGTGDSFSHVRETGDVLTLPVNTLDTALKQAGIEPVSVDVLVLDVQGAELMCLKGASETLRSVTYLEAEVSSEPVYEGGVLAEELEDWLRKRFFKRRTRLRRAHMDAIFTRDGK